MTKSTDSNNTYVLDIRSMRSDLCDPSSSDLRVNRRQWSHFFGRYSFIYLLSTSSIVLRLNYNSHRVIMSRSTVLSLLLSLLVAQSDAFAPTLPFTKYAAATAPATSNRAVVTAGIGIQHTAPSSPVALHMIDPVQSSMLVAAAEPWVQPTISVLDPFLNLFSFAMVRNVTLRLSSSYRIVT
jgi:hypothetical protein